MSSDLGYYGFSSPAQIERARKLQLYEISKQVSAFLNCTPFVRQYGILDNKWVQFICISNLSFLFMRRKFCGQKLHGLKPLRA